MLTPVLTASMSSRSDNIFFPTTIQIENSPGEQIKPKKPVGGLRKLYKVPPTQIAKRVEPDIVLDDNEPSSPIRNRLLQQISEDPFEHSPILPPERSGTHTERSEGLSSPGKKSIFQTEGFQSSKYQEIGKGPTYRLGKLVKHSIVGTQENFERYQRRRLYFGRPQDADTSSITSHNESILGLSKPFRQSSGMSLTDLTPLKQASTAKKIIESKYKDREIHKEVRISKEQLMNEISNVRERQQDFYFNIEETSHHLKTSDKLYFTKEKRCLENFEKTQEKWLRLVEDTNHKLGRSPTESVAVKAESFRAKKEKADAFDIIKEDPERFGTYHWYMSLRKVPGAKEKRGTILTEDFPTAFKSGVLDRPPSSLEIVRKPKQLLNTTISTTFDTSMNNTLSSPKLSERTAREYYENRFMKNREQINKIKATSTDPDSLMVNRFLFPMFLMFYLLVGWRKRIGQ